MTSPVRWESVPCASPTICPQRCATPTPPFLPSRRLSADCLALSLLIRPIALCRRHAQHLSYHCLDNSLLVQKSLPARRSHDDDTVTLPGGSEPPAEIAHPLSSTSVSFFARPSASFLPFPLLAAAPPTPPGARSSEGACGRQCANTHVYAGGWDTQGQ